MNIADSEVCARRDDSALALLGPRICILGPSGSGKSTLAVAIGRKCGVPVVHLDQLRHRPGTDWEPRPETDFVALHDAAIERDAWVIDGNYSVCLAQRLARATGVILLDVSAGVSLWRYIRRCAAPLRRIGGLEGNQDSLKWEMVRHIVWTSPANRRRYAALFAEITLPKIRLASHRRVSDFFHEAVLGR